MIRKNYIIKYTVISNNNIVLKNGKIRAKNRLSELDAKIKLEAYLNKKYRNFGRLIVHDCYIDNRINSIFGDIFGVDNVFNNKK